jgi:hypothetical protein
MVPLSCWFAFNCDNNGFSCRKTVAKWNLSLSLSQEYIHPDSLQTCKGERRTHIVTSIVCRGANYLAIEMKFCVPLSFPWHCILSWWKDRLAPRRTSLRCQQSFRVIFGDLWKKCLRTCLTVSRVALCNPPRNNVSPKVVYPAQKVNHCKMCVPEVVHFCWD